MRVSSRRSSGGGLARAMPGSGRAGRRCPPPSSFSSRARRATVPGAPPTSAGPAADRWRCWEAGALLASVRLPSRSPWPGLELACPETRLRSTARLGKAQGPARREEERRAHGRGGAQAAPAQPGFLGSRSSVPPPSTQPAGVPSSLPPPLRRPEDPICPQGRLPIPEDAESNGRNLSRALPDRT